MVHLVIMREPYLGRVLDGSKTIEARFLRARAAPYGQVEPGDLLYLKRAGGPIVATAYAAAVRQYADLTPAHVIALLNQFEAELCIDPAFAALVRKRRYAVLIWLAEVQRLQSPQPYPRRDRRGWVVLGAELKIRVEGRSSTPSPE